MTTLRHRLTALADPERTAKQQRYLKSTQPCYGVSVPDVRRIAKQVLRQYPIDDSAVLRCTLLELWDRGRYREERYAALAIAASPCVAQLRSLELLPLYRHLVESGAWWDLVDDVAVHLIGPLLRTDPATRVTVAREMRQWAHDQDLWIRRTAILCQIGAREDTEPGLLRDTIEPSLGRTEFFLRKAIGWGLRDFSRWDAPWVREYLEQNRDRLSALSYREAAKHLG